MHNYRRSTLKSFVFCVPPRNESDLRKCLMLFNVDECACCSCSCAPLKVFRVFDEPIFRMKCIHSSFFAHFAVQARVLGCHSFLTYRRKWRFISFKGKVIYGRDRCTKQFKFKWTTLFWFFSRAAGNWILVLSIWSHNCKWTLAQRNSSTKPINDSLEWWMWWEM